MRDITKKIISIFAATALLGGTAMMAACGEKNYVGTKLDYTPSQNEAVDNGGFAVEKDGYVYFINGSEAYTVSNKFGEVVKGSLMRIKTADLESGKYETAQTVVPMLMVAQNFASGIYIYGDYVYYATPTTDKAVDDGTVQNDWIDFKRAKLDGTETMSGYYFRLSNNAATYRFVKADDGNVYCMYVEDSALKSYNTVTGKTTVLVESAASEFFFDEKDLTNDTVYYTMNVTPKFESESRPQEKYTQIYKVKADAKATVNASEASYTTSYGTKYDFDLSYMKDNEKGFDASDYTTYPYVNLGELIVDGIGSSSTKTQFNESDGAQAKELSGYTYTLQRNENGGLYYTNTPVNGATASPVYYVSDTETSADGWKTVDGANETAPKKIADSADVLSKALIEADQSYIYLNGTTLTKVLANGETVEMAYNLSDITLLETEGDYLYYYATGTNGNNLSRINYKGDEAAETLGYDPYNPLADLKEYQKITVDYIDWNSAWYNPEFFGGKVLYSGAQSYGTNSYNYIYAADVSMDNEALEAKNEQYKEVNDYITEYAGDDSDLLAAMQYVFRVGNTAAIDEVESEYETVQINEYKAFAAHKKSENKTANDYSTMFKNEAGNYYDRENYYVNRIGKVKASDADEMADGLASSLPTIVSEETEEEFPVWAIVLISVGGALIVAAAIVIPVVVYKKKQAKRLAAIESTRVRERKKIDTTDDKSINVYEDEPTDEPEDGASDSVETSEDNDDQ